MHILHMDFYWKSLQCMKICNYRHGHFRACKLELCFEYSELFLCNFLKADFFLQNLINQIFFNPECTNPRLLFSTNQQAAIYSWRCCLLLSAIFPSQATSWQGLFTNYHGTLKRMVRRCAWGICNVNSRYPDHMQGIQFYQISNPKTS